MTTLKGIAWNHTRGFVSVVACAQRFEELHPDVTIVWEKRSLQAYADASLADLATAYDLIIMNHPHTALAATEGLLLPYEDWLTAEFLADQATNSIGRSHESYRFQGKQWTLANDAATPIATWRPEYENFAAHLEATAHPHLVGYRRMLHTQPDELSTTPLFRQNVARIGMAGLTFDLCLLPHQLAAGAALIDACPDTRFILDHCGVPGIASGDLAFWREQLREISRRPNLACKISGIIAYAAGEITADTLCPVVEHAIDCFGWDRVVWGSDWPVCNLTRDLVTWTRLLDEILSACSEDELARLNHCNAREIYHLTNCSSNISAANS